jgi:hypothetical protein
LDTAGDAEMEMYGLTLLRLAALVLDLRMLRVP